MVRVAVKQRPRDQWIEELEAAGIPCSPLHTLGELSDHPHTSQSGMVFTYQHPVLGETKGVSQPLKFDGHRAELRNAPPSLGEHTREILEEIGYSPERIDLLMRDGVTRPQ